MPEVLISEEELGNYRNVHAFLTKALSDPKTRRKVLEVQKELNPNAAIPELDAAEPINQELSQMRKQMTEFMEATAKREEDREKQETTRSLNSKWEKGRDGLRAQGYSEDGIKAVEDLMEKEGILNHDAGLAYFERLNPPNEALNSSGGKFNIFNQSTGQDDLMKTLIESGGDPHVFDQQLNKIMSDIRTESRAAGRR